VEDAIQIPPFAEGPNPGARSETPDHSGPDGDAPKRRRSGSSRGSGSGRGRRSPAKPQKATSSGRARPAPQTPRAPAEQPAPDPGRPARSSASSARAGSRPDAGADPKAAATRKPRRGGRGGQRRRPGSEAAPQAAPQPSPAEAAPPVAAADIGWESETQPVAAPSPVSPAPVPPPAAPLVPPPTLPAADPWAIAEDGWPEFDQPVPGEDVAPEAEPPTEEVVLEPGGGVAAPEAPRGAAGPDDAFGERRGRRRRRRGRGGRDRDDRGAPEAGGFEPAAPGPSDFGPSSFEQSPFEQPSPGAGEAPAEAGFDENVPVVEPLAGEATPADEDLIDVAREESPERPSAPSGNWGGLHFFRPERLEACQKAIGYHFRDMSLLENALTHSSIKSDDRPSYERLEFLGDSVVGLVMTEYLYNLLPDCDEGEMTKIKSAVVSTDGLANAAKVCGLDRFLAVGRGLMMRHEVPRSLIADVFEGVAGAVYLDRGYESARLYVLDHLRPFVEEALSEGSARNFKSVLQQVAQRDLGETPYYDLLREWGPEHSRNFEVVAVLGRRRFPAARAPTKKEAEQAAAKIALQTILLERGAGAISRRRRDQHEARPPQGEPGRPPQGGHPPAHGRGGPPSGHARHGGPGPHGDGRPRGRRRRRGRGPEGRGPEGRGGHGRGDAGGPRPGAGPR
jgi:ribonuclease-3